MSVLNLLKLNNQQREAVEYNDGPLLIVAGAGSGKTRVITYKIAYLINEGIRADQILAVTFTNKAANEMMERVNDLLNTNFSNVFISTFHKFCMYILRSYIETIGYNRNFTIYDTDDQKKLMTKILDDNNDKQYKPKKILSAISFCKSHNITKEEYSNIAQSDVEKTIAKYFIQYEEELKKMNAVDFDDILLLAVKILKTNDYARQMLNEKFKYILIDEYQDTNLVQFELIKLLRQKYKYLTVVGDEDQSIYKFRGADISNILSFEKAFEDAKIIKLTENYRSTNNILKTANSLIKHNTERKDKQLWSHNPSGNKVIFTEYSSNTDEANNVIRSIKENKNINDTAILYRTNSQSRVLEEACMKNSLPYQIVGGLGFYERKEIKDILAYLKVLSNSNDDLSLIRIVNIPKRGVGDTTITKLIDYAKEKNTSLYNAMADIENINIKSKCKNNIKQLIDDYTKMKQLHSVSEMINYILKDIGYENFLKDEYGDVDAQDRLNNIRELIIKSSIFEANSNDTENNNNSINSIDMLSEFLYDVSLVSNTDDMENLEDKVTLMTIHASKGLEFNNVYIVGLTQDLFPNGQAIQEGDLEEERRLCYVAITRAKENLYMSSAKVRYINGQYIDSPHSIFINEIEGDFIEKHFYENKFDFSNYYNNNFINKNKFQNKKNVGITYNNQYDNKISSQNKDYNLKQSDFDLSKYKINNDNEKPDINFAIGDIVIHKTKFGIGKVVNITDIGKDYEITVVFDDFGEKHLYQKFAKLEKEN